MKCDIASESIPPNFKRFPALSESSKPLALEDIMTSPSEIEFPLRYISLNLSVGDPKSYIVSKAGIISPTAL